MGTLVRCVRTIAIALAFVALIGVPVQADEALPATAVSVTITPHEHSEMIAAAVGAQLSAHGFSVIAGAPTDASAPPFAITGTLTAKATWLTAVLELRSQPANEALIVASFGAATATDLANAIARDLWGQIGPTIEERRRRLDATLQAARDPALPPPTVVPVEAPVAPLTSDAPLDLIHVGKDGVRNYRQGLTIARRRGSISIDGALDPAWANVPETLINWRQKPSEGVSTNNTATFRMVYDDDAAYLFVDLHDSLPEKVRGVLNRGDNSSATRFDFVEACLDPTLSRRIAYCFMVNPEGVKVDYLVPDDGLAADLSYNPIWEVATRRSPTGWFAELRIPYSQLRLAPGYSGPWGVQVHWRRTADAVEDYQWSPWPFTAGRFASVMGEVTMAGTIRAHRSVQVLPFTAGGVELRPVASGNMIGKEQTYVGKVGADVQIALLPGLRLTSAVLPDFGQVEADPSEVNLTGRETFFSERRPFFTTDSELFNLGIGRGATERLYYTRRVGAPPRLSQAGGGGGVYVDEPRETTIYTANKLTGQLPGAVTLGLVSAWTAKETSTAQLATGELRDATIEPSTLYNVAQLGRTFRQGESDLRLSATAVKRFLDGTGIKRLHAQAYTGGLQYEHRFAKKKWAIFTQVLGSYVAGDPEAITATQVASLRYFQRPDARHLELDTTRTSLSGYGGRMALKHAGLNWKGTLGVDARSPGFETNDLGFLLDADLINGWFEVGYGEIAGAGILKQIDTTAGLDTFADFSGEVLRNRVTAKLTLTWKSNSQLGASAARVLADRDTRLLRGGPSVADTDETSLGIFYVTDPKKPYGLRPSVDHAYRIEATSRRSTFALDARWSLRPNIELNLTPTYQSIIDNNQFLPPAQMDTGGGVHYLLGRINQRSLFVTTRLSYTPTTKLSIDLYAQPFVSVGRFREFKELGVARSTSYEQRFPRIETSDAGMGMIAADLDRDGMTDVRFRNPDFSVTRLNANLVVRWEYRAGSFISAIWSNSARSTNPDGDLTKADIKNVYTSDREQIFLLKVSYWWDR